MLTLVFYSLLIFLEAVDQIIIVIIITVDMAVEAFSGHVQSY